MISAVFEAGLEAYMYNFWASLTTEVDLIFLKYLETWFTSFWDLAEIEGGILSMLARTNLFLLVWSPLEIGFTLEVNFAEIFYLKV